MSLFDHINFEAIVADLHEGLYVVDRNRRILYWNKAAEKLTGFSAEEVIGSRCADNILMHVDEAGNNLCQGMCPLAATMKDGKHRRAEFFLHHKSGHRLPVRVRVAPLINEQGEIIGGVELFSDNQDRQAIHEEITRLRNLALIDPLTELPNRRYIESHIESSFSQLLRIDMPFGLLFIDIDHFKKFNDDHGHLVGDQALKIVAATLKHAIRSFDVVGRWGGEEFLGVFPNLTPSTLGRTAERLRVLVEKSRVAAEDKPLRITVSIGGVMATAEDTLNSLIQKADSAMYTSKQQGRNRVTVHVFTPE